MKEVYVIRDLWNNYGAYEDYEHGMEVYGIFDDFQKAKEAVIDTIHNIYGPSKKELLITPESTFEYADVVYLECGILYFGIDEDDERDESHYDCTVYRHEIDIIKVPINQIDMNFLDGGLV